MRDGWLSWPCWLTDSGRLNHKMVTHPASSLAQDRESLPAETSVLTTMLYAANIAFKTVYGPTRVLKEEVMPILHKPTLGGFRLNTSLTGLYVKPITFIHKIDSIELACNT